VTEYEDINDADDDTVDISVYLRFEIDDHGIGLSEEAANCI